MDGFVGSLPGRRVGRVSQRIRTLDRAAPRRAPRLFIVQDIAMTSHAERGAAEDTDAYVAVEQINHAFLTGLILTLVTRADAQRAAEVVFRTFRRQQLARFVPGLKKLGLEQLPHAVACAQYHYLSNQVGGVKVEYVYESDHKAWVRYPPPRWIWSGTAICAIPSQVSSAMLRGWHANNRAVLGNARLGFVCTGQTVDGQAGLEGYYKEWDHELDAHERLQFSTTEQCPPFRAELTPRLPAQQWPQARLIGMHTFDAAAALLGGVAPGAAGFAHFLLRIARGQRDDAVLRNDGDARTWFESCAERHRAHLRQPAPRSGGGT